MFVAKFSQTSGAPFTQDKNGNFPFIGEVLAGASQGSIINGTMFHRNGLEPNTLYACENVHNEEYNNYDTVVLGKVSLLEYGALRTQLGAPRKIEASAPKAVATAEVVNTEATPFE